MGANKRFRDIPRQALVFGANDITKSFVIKGGVGPPNYSVSSGDAETTLIEIPNWISPITAEFQAFDQNGNMTFHKANLAANQVSPTPVRISKHDDPEAEYPIFEGCVITVNLSAAPGTALALGSTHTNVANGAFTFAIAGTGYSKIAVPIGTALAAGTIPQNKWGIYRFSIVAGGTITVTPGSANGTGYGSEALAILALPALPASSADMGYVTVMSTVSGGFQEGTSNLNDTGVTANYYPVGGGTVYVTIYYK
jgi:hypothetical protein